MSASECWSSPGGASFRSTFLFLSLSDGAPSSRLRAQGIPLC
jgi:hypothetical protein